VSLPDLSCQLIQPAPLQERTRGYIGSQTQHELTVSHYCKKSKHFAEKYKGNCHR